MAPGLKLFHPSTALECIIIHKSGWSCANYRYVLGTTLCSLKTLRAGSENLWEDEVDRLPIGAQALNFAARGATSFAPPHARVHLDFIKMFLRSQATSLGPVWRVATGNRTLIERRSRSGASSHDQTKVPVCVLTNYVNPVDRQHLPSQEPE
jgi:hypothetical protein